MKPDNEASRAANAWILGGGIALIMHALFSQPLLALLLMLINTLGYDPETAGIILNTFVSIIIWIVATLAPWVRVLALPMLIVGMWMFYYGLLKVHSQRSRDKTT